MTVVVLTIPCRPTTKKTSGNVVFKRVPTQKLPTGFCVRCKRASLPIVLPSEKFVEYQAAAVPHLRQQWGGRPPLAVPVRVSATFYREALRGDLVGFMQALADVLQTAHVVDDDKWIVNWDGTRMSKDADHPRVELELWFLDEIVPQLSLLPPPAKGTP